MTPSARATRVVPNRVPDGPSRFLPDNFTLALVGTVVLASFLPCRGPAAHAFNWATNIAVGLLFFLHGAKLSREAVIAGATRRLHAVVLLSTFALFPLLGLALKPVLQPLVTPTLYAGVLFLHAAVDGPVVDRVRRSRRATCRPPCARHPRPACSGSSSRRRSSG